MTEKIVESKKNLTAKCDECGHIFKLTSDNLFERELVAKNEPIIFLGFCCPACSKLYRISIRSVLSNRYNNSIAAMRQSLQLEMNIYELTKNYKRQIEISKIRVRIQSEIKLLQQELQRLKEKYPGTFTIDTSKNKEMENIIDYHESMEEGV